MWRSILTAGTLATVVACSEVQLPTAELTPEAAHVVGPLPINGPFERVDLGVSGKAVDINTATQVLVSADIDGVGHAFLWHEGVLRDIGTMGGASTVATDINDSGQVYGASQAADSSWHTFLWTDGVFADLGTRGPAFMQGGGTPPIQPRTGGRLLNSRGEVAWTTGPAGAERATLWRNGAVQDLGTLGGPTSMAAAINDAGQVAGFSTVTDSGPNHLFLWENGVMRDLGAASGSFGKIVDLNEAGQILLEGFVGPPSSRTQRMYLFDGETVRDITVGTNSLPADINDRGQIAGTTGGDIGWGGGHIFRWESGSAEIGAYGFAVAMNEPGTLAGYIPHVGRPYVVVWEGEILWRLEDPPSGGGQFSQPYAINARGDVAGVKNGRAMLWRRRDLPPPIAP